LDRIRIRQKVPDNYGYGSATLPPATLVIDLQDGKNKLNFFKNFFLTDTKDPDPAQNLDSWFRIRINEDKIISDPTDPDSDSNHWF
jgi:hypothetical protein